MISDDFFKRIETQYESQLPFVTYRKPRESRVDALLQKTNELHFIKDFTEKGFVFAPFDATEKSVLIPFASAEVLETNYIISERLINKPVTNSVSSEAKNQHINLVKKGVEAINESHFKKVVLSRNEIVNLTDINPIIIFKNLLNTYVSAFVYCWYHPKIGLWLGATPETLMKIDGHQFSIMALAGTQNFNGSLDVVWKEKELQEQKIVTDFIIESLESSVENINISETETVKAGNLLHLKTMISAQLQSTSNLKNLISKLHPTPAVCGFPKVAAKHFILKNEHYKREFYTGFLGELNFEISTSPRSSKRNIENRAYTIIRKSSQLYVNLRCMQLKKSNAILYIGGGITASSNPESEWDETVSKSLVIKNIL